ncbi:3-keto-5-aminohexanoate cleavage protein [Anoxybacter fermentans]|uniref:3-keto-5-aminohexanoate cleavage protein n=1 Tax=Anoxybacter fermentans TaxID=1323375 RepID=A0A3S9T0D2_9FIRM|nr:3-keto-5-aminohexanoate cleavage protein [Anoxybacter fermentans]AZR74063.1 3-keto-5-aminohexanoate cleavage protein [Anoxybacter fermentans]
MEKLIITAAICGAEVTKEQNPNLPITPDELAQAAYDAEQAGASIIHLHVRDENGNPTQSEEVFREVIEKIKAKGCKAIIQPSTGGAVGMTAEERIQPLNLRPEMATLSTGSVNFGDDVFLNSPEYIEFFASRMKELGIKPEIEVFEVGMINNALRLVKKGLIEPPLHFDFVMGVPGGIPGEVEDLLHLVRKIPEGSTWSVAGIGRYELPLAVMAIIMGGHVRVGFEDNIYYSKGVLAESNAQLVERIVRIAKEVGREIATPDEAREILHIKR